MKRIVAILLILLVGQPVFSQNCHSAFVAEMLKEYHKKEAKFKRSAAKWVEKRQEYSGKAFPDTLHYMPIPHLCLKKRPESFYRNADPADPVKYFDPKSMRMIVFMLMDGNYNFVKRFPELKSKENSSLFDFYMKYKPELIFGVLNMPCDFAIIDNKLYAIIYNGEEGLPQDIAEYAAENKEDILLGLRFGYQPL